MCHKYHEKAIPAYSTECNSLPRSSLEISTCVSSYDINYYLQSWVIGIFFGIRYSVPGCTDTENFSVFRYLYWYRIPNHAISVFFPVFIKNIKNPYWKILYTLQPLNTYWNLRYIFSRRLQIYFITYFRNHI